MEIISIVTGAASAAVTLAEARTHLGLESGQTAQDAYIGTLLAPAQDAVEDWAGLFATRRSVTARYRVGMDWQEMLHLPRRPLASLGSITYSYDDADTDDVDALANYRIARYGDKARLPMLALLDDPPTETDAPDEIAVVYTAGFASVPPVVKRAILQLITDWVSFRGSAEELLAGRLARDLPGSWKETLTSGGYPGYSGW